MRPSGWERVGRLLVVRLDNVGDVIMLGPALRTLRRAMPDVHLTLMASPAGSQAATLLPWIDEVMIARVVWQDASASLPLDPDRERDLVDAMRRGRFDAAIVFTSFSQSPWPAAYACYLAGIPLRAGQSKEFGGSLLSHWVRSGADSLHQVDRNLALVTALGFDAAGRDVEIRIDPASRREAIALLREAGIGEQRFAVVAPRASCAARTYPLERFSRAIADLPGALNAPVIVVGSTRDGDVIHPAVRSLAGVTSLVGRTSIPTLAAVIERSTLGVVNNSGPMHLADACRVPLVVLYSGSEYEDQWRPRASVARLLRRPTDCSPCYQFTCPFSMQCLDIAPADVVRHCAELFAEARRGSRAPVADPAPHVSRRVSAASGGGPA